MNYASRIARLAAVGRRPAAGSQPACTVEDDRTLWKTRRPSRRAATSSTKKTPRLNPTPIPRGYALIIGIANYKNLPAKSQLEFPERDAEAIYSILISPEGGNFRAENVHRLIGAKATLANCAGTRTVAAFGRQGQTTAC